MWIIDKDRIAVNLDNCISIYSSCEKENDRYIVTAWEAHSEDAASYNLAEFENEDDADKYITDLVKKLNGDK